jgi:hypothetical protein
MAVTSSGTRAATQAQNANGTGGSGLNQSIGASRIAGSANLTRTISRAE